LPWEVLLPIYLLWRSIGLSLLQVNGRPDLLTGFPRHSLQLAGQVLINAVTVQVGTSRRSKTKNPKPLNGNSVDALWPFRPNKCPYRGPCMLKIGLFLRCENSGSNRVAALESKMKSSSRQFLEDCSFMDYFSFLPRPRIRWEVSGPSKTRAMTAATSE
jgi:hypothetical protein